MEQKKLAVFGYGNLGKGVELAIRQNPDMKAVGVFTRRDPASVRTLTGVPVYAAEEIDAWQGKIDAVILCGGSATDLPVWTPRLAGRFNVVDSFDTHAKIPEHFDRVDAAAKAAGTTALISGGWDPGLFSLARLYGGVILPEGQDYTFWGPGVSQGHSDAIRRIPGVIDARQYTVPVPETVERVRNGECPELTARQKHRRECFVAAEAGADRETIARTIKTMPNYFADYDTTVTFVTPEELKEKHSALPHGGFVIRTGRTGRQNEHSHRVEYSLSLDSNPEFTSCVLTALARAVCRLNARGDIGCKTVFDIAPADLSPLSGAELRARML